MSLASSRQAQGQEEGQESALESDPNTKNTQEQEQEHKRECECDHASTTTLPAFDQSDNAATAGNDTSSDSDDANDDSSETKSNVHDMSKEEDKVNEIVGVSLGRAQDRFKSRSTPVEEKTCMFEDDFEGHDVPATDDTSGTNDGAAGLYLPEIRGDPGPQDKRKQKQDQTVDKDKRASAELSPERDDQETLHPFKDEDSDRRGRHKRGTSRSSLTKSLLNRVPRDISPNFSSLKKFVPTNFSVRPRSVSLRLPKPRFDWDRDEQRSAAGDESSSQHPMGSRNDDSASSDRKPSALPRRPSSSSSVRVNEKGPNLRRTASDRSLYLTNSLASALEGTDRYENVHSQVNIRFKAIMDSLYDSGRGLGGLVPSLRLPDFQFGENRTQGNGTDSTHQPQSGESDSDQSQQDNQSFLSEAMSGLTGDVVIMGGYRGSILRTAQPPHRQMWIPMKAGLNLRKVDIELGLHPEDDENAEATIIPGEILSHVGPVDVCRKLIRRLQKCDNAVKGDLRVTDFAYDWRLNPRLLADKLVTYLKDLPCNDPALPPEKRGAYVIAHSLGGLIARHAVNQRPDLFAGVIYAGTPRHCVNILGPLRTGEDVLLNSRVLTAQVSFSFRTSFALLPESGRCFFNRHTGERYNLDFFSPQTWEEYRLSPVVKPALPAQNEKSMMENIPIIGRHLASGKEDTPEESASDAAASSSEIPTSDASLSSSSLQAPGHAKDQQQHHDQLQKHEAAPPVETTNRTAAAIQSDSHGVIGPNPISRHVPQLLPDMGKANAGKKIAPDEAMNYLERVLPDVLHFKQDLAFNHAHQTENIYPPFAVLYSRSTPTVYGARVSSREQIKHENAYDDLAFAAGDGVVLASASMLPPCYRIIRGGLVESERGHVSLLGDLEGVGKCLLALMKGRSEGVGLGPSRKVERH